MGDSFLTFDDFKSLTIMPSGDIDLVEIDTPGFVAAQLVVHSARIRSRLRKRYDTERTPYPDVIRAWLATVVTPIVYRKRGVNPSDPQMTVMDDERKAADAEMKEAADSETGLFDLPLREDTDATGISKGGPLGCSEPSPYDWMHSQAEAIRGR